MTWPAVPFAAAAEFRRNPQGGDPLSIGEWRTTPLEGLQKGELGPQLLQRRVGEGEGHATLRPSH